MKTLVLTLITTFSFHIIMAQAFFPKNEVVVHTESEDGVSTINWTSYQEVNTAYYLIERSDDGKQFYTIGKTKAGSSTYSATDYTFEDVDAGENFHTYRITLVFMDGQQISVEEQNNSYDNLVDTIGK